MKETQKQEKGITLIALVITIIVLMILAAISMATLTGENGIITKAQEAKRQTEIASVKEQIQIDIFGKQAENNGNISEDTLKGILERYGTLSGEENLADKTLTTDKGKYEIKVSDIFNGTTVKDVPKNPTFTTVANAPNINGFDRTKTYYVSWDLTNSPYSINEDTNLNGTEPSNWYDYTEGVNHWANIKTTGGENACYWVWIPRYAYKVPTKGDTAETIEIKFLQGKTNQPIGETTQITNTTPTPGTWVVHPAFTSLGNGGFGEVEGIWIAKYEASSSSVSENTVTSDLTTTGGGNVTNLQVRVKPNVTSWRGITVNNIFTVCRNLTKAGNSLENTSKINSHMMKNTEWGAVAYLSRSVYGMNDEIWNNPYYNDITNCSPITGLCSNEIDGKDKGITDIAKTCKYNEAGGGKASTTGNVYGVYDMAGGAWEYVAGIYKGGESDDNISKLWDSNNLKYVDQYTETTGSQSTYYGNTNKYGDAVYETSSSGNSSTGSWDSGNSVFPISLCPVFIRGGRAGLGGIAGIFTFYWGGRSGDAAMSFRPVVLSSQS